MAGPTGGGEEYKGGFSQKRGFFLWGGGNGVKRGKGWGGGVKRGGVVGGGVGARVARLFFFFGAVEVWGV